MDIVQSLRNVIRDHAKETTFTGHVRIADMAHDCLREIESLREQLSVYQAAEQEGRLHITPVADGTAIWIVGLKEEVEYDSIIENLSIFPPPPDFAEGEEKFSYRSFYCWGMTEFQNGELGVGWFLSREEALKAIGVPVEKGTEDERK